MAVVTDGLRSYRAALLVLAGVGKQDTGITTVSRTRTCRFDDESGPRSASVR